MDVASREYRRNPEQPQQTADLEALSFVSIYHRWILSTIVPSLGHDIAGIIPWFLIFRLLRRETIPSSVSLYDHLVVSVMRRVESAVRPPVGKNLLLVGERRD